MVLEPLSGHTNVRGPFFPPQVCGVAILRAGEVLEPAFLSVCKDATIGKILIQTNEGTGEPELHFLRLPQNIADCHVILMDATIATGAAAIMAIRVLLVRPCLWCDRTGIELHASFSKCES